LKKAGTRLLPRLARSLELFKEHIERTARQFRARSPAAVRAIDRCVALRLEIRTRSCLTRLRRGTPRSPCRPAQPVTIALNEGAAPEGPPADFDYEFEGAALRVFPMNSSMASGTNMRSILVARSP